MRPSRNRFSFGDNVFKSLGEVKLNLATPPNAAQFYVYADVVALDAPALIELEVLDRENLTAESVRKKLVK